MITFADILRAENEMLPLEICVVNELRGMQFAPESRGRKDTR